MELNGLAHHKLQASRLIRRNEEMSLLRLPNAMQTKLKSEQFFNEMLFCTNSSLELTQDEATKKGMG